MVLQLKPIREQRLHHELFLRIPLFAIHFGHGYAQRVGWLSMDVITLLVDPTRPYQLCRRLRLHPKRNQDIHP
jgi:hypothetical protein